MIMFPDLYSKELLENWNDVDGEPFRLSELLKGTLQICIHYTFEECEGTYEE